VWDGVKYCAAGYGVFRLFTILQWAKSGATIIRMITISATAIVAFAMKFWI